jgi:hypothetical protein
MTPEIKISGAGVVVLGDFVPTIFHPSWFSQKNLLPQQEADNAKLEVMHPEITAFTTDWLDVKIMQNRFSASCLKDDSLPLLKDLVLGTLHFFSETPVKALGINRDYHFQLSSEPEWHAVGDKLTPKGPWKDLLLKPGMHTVKMQGLKEDPQKGSVNVTVQPSMKVKPNGVYVQINDHYAFEKDSKIPVALRVFADNWSSSLERAAKIASSLVSA